MNLSLNRVILYVQNVESLKNFYQKHFHFQLSEEIKEEWAVITAGNCEIALHKVGAPYQEKNPDFQQNRYVNNVKLVFETVDDLHELREELLRNNVGMKEVRTFKGVPYLYCDGLDTEGNIFQIMQKISGYAP